MVTVSTGFRPANTKTAWPWPASTIMIDVDATKARMEAIMRQVGMKKFKTHYPMHNKVLEAFRGLSGLVGVLVVEKAIGSVKFRIPAKPELLQLAMEFFPGFEREEILKEREETIRMSAEATRRAKEIQRENEKALKAARLSLATAQTAPEQPKPAVSAKQDIRLVKGSRY